MKKISTCDLIHRYPQESPPYSDRDRALVLDIDLELEEKMLTVTKNIFVHAFAMTISVLLLQSANAATFVGANGVLQKTTHLVQARPQVQLTGDRSYGARANGSYRKGYEVNGHRRANGRDRYHDKRFERRMERERRWRKAQMERRRQALLEQERLRERQHRREQAQKTITAILNTLNHAMQSEKQEQTEPAQPAAKPIEIFGAIAREILRAD